MIGLSARPTSSDIAGRVTLGLTMIDSRKAAIIRDRFWRERTWPVIARERHCSVTTAVKRYKQGMDDLARAIMLVEGTLPDERCGAAVQGTATLSEDEFATGEQTGFPPSPTNATRITEKCS